MPEKFHPRRAFAVVVAGIVLSTLMLTDAVSADANPPLTPDQLPADFRIGYQKSSVNLTIMKSRRALEQRFPGLKISWFEFNAGPQLLEALSVGSIDFGMTGDTPPIFAQAAGSRLTYVAAEPAKPDNSAVLVRPDSPVRQLSDLSGKKIAFQKGSSAHFLAIKAIQAAGLDWKDITPVYLTPAEARAAFERGSVDAWVIWDPYWAAVETALKPRVLATSRGLTSNHSFYLSSAELAGRYPALLRAVFAELTRSDEFVRDSPQEAARMLGESTGLSREILDIYILRRPRSPVLQIDESIVAEQQEVADTFRRQNLIPKPIQVRAAVWQPSADVAAKAIPKR